jgi:hypothetical protein
MSCMNSVEIMISSMKLFMHSTETLPLASLLIPRHLHSTSYFSPSSGTGVVTGQKETRADGEMSGRFICQGYCIRPDRKG